MKLKKIKRAALAMSIATLLLMAGPQLFGQAPDTSPGDKPVTKPPPSPGDEYQTKLGKLTKNPNEFVPTLLEFINKFPNSERAYAYFYSIKRTLANGKDADEVKKLSEKLTRGLESQPAGARLDAYRYIGDALYSQGLYDDAVALALKNISLFDETAYLDFKRKENDFTNADLIARNPKFKARPFDEERGRIGFVGVETASYNLLAKSLWEQKKFSEAESAFRSSFSIKVSKESALGIARASEKNGKDDEALKYATVAALTGKLEHAEMDYFYSTYAKLHDGSMAGVEEYLNAEYKKTYRNPVNSQKYARSPKRSDRVVLAELVTGAGCVPCIPFDYTFEKALGDYSSRELAILEYDWHAPTMDPLGNNSSDSRVKYYDVHGAPTLVIDGAKFQKDLDYNGGSGEADKIQKIADNVNEDIRAELEAPASALITLKAKRSNEKVSVSVDADKFRAASNDVTLQIALVENEAVYSGENGLRFHFMVVRALAGDNDTRIFGFKIDPSEANKFDYTFDVYRIVAQNFDYYDTQTSERMKEFLGRMGGKMPEGLNIDFGFKYKRNQIDPRHLSVVAFLQDNKTKKILQSAVVNLASK